MSALWQKLLRATGLVRTGRLDEATAEIQRELRRSMDASDSAKPPPRDVEASFDAPAPAGTPSAPAPPASAGEAPRGPAPEAGDGEAVLDRAHAPASTATSDDATVSAPASASAPSPAHATPAASAATPEAAVPPPPVASPADGATRPAAAAPGPAPASARGVPPAPPPAGTDREAVIDAERPPGRFLVGRSATPFGTRDFKLHAPGGDAASTRGRPLLVLLHGCKQDPDDFARGTGMNAIAERLGAFVLYPAQGARSNAMRCWNWFQPGDQRRGAGEPALIAAMVEDVVREHAIDRDRVYVAGLSAGGAMAAILARAYPDVFAAAGIHSGLAPGAARDVGSAFQAMAAPGRHGKSASDPAGAPLIVFQGDADTTVHPLNARLLLDSLLGSEAHPAQQETGDGGRAGHGWTRSVYREAAPGAAGDSAGPSRAELWLVHGLGHAWSGGSPGGSYTDESGPDASQAMLRFFLAHPRRPASRESND